MLKRRCPEPNPRFVPIDVGAKDGAFHLLRDSAGHQHCAQWDGRAFVYQGGHPIGREITHYAARVVT